MNQPDLMTRQEREAEMQTLAKAQTTMTEINSQLAEVEKLVYANDPQARAALQSLSVKLATADQEFTQFEKMMESDDTDTDSVIRFNINLKPSGRTN